MLTAAQQYAIDQFAKGLLTLGDDALIDRIIKLRMISGQLRLRVATTSAKPTRRHLRPKGRCEIGSLIIEPAIKCGTREQTLPHHHSGGRAPGDGQGAGFPITIRPGKSVIRTAVRKGRTQ